MKHFYVINLQLFAETPHGEVNVTSDLSPEMKTFYDKNLIRLAEPKLVHGQFGVKKPIPAGNGKKIEFRKATPLVKALKPLDEGVTPEGNKLDFTKLEAEALQYGDYITQSDVLELTAIDNTIVEATRLLSSQAASTLDTVDRDALQGGNNVFYCPDLSGAIEDVDSRAKLTEASLLTTDVIMQVVAQLRAANAPTFEDGYYVAIIHPHVALDVMTDENWRKPHEYVNTENIYRGEIGEDGEILQF